MEFQDRVVLITGGSSGIGAATARAFGREGARVAIASRGEERGHAFADELRSAGAEAEFFRADVAEPADVESLVRDVIDRFGGLDIAFNNAASLEAGAFQPLAEVEVEDWDRAMRTNLRSVWLCMRAQLRHMHAHGGGVILNTASVNGLGGVAGNGLYAAAKAGVIALSKSAALEHAAHGIRVNALVAGAFRTPMLETVFDTMGGGDPEAAAQAEQAFAGHIPLGRIGRPEEAAEAVLWVCSDRASFLTGASFILDGGMTTMFR